MKDIILRPYQSEIILESIRFLKRDKMVAIVAAVASGKTLMCNAIVHKMNFKKVIIATPFLHIGKTYDNKTDVMYHFASEFGSSCSYIVKENSSIFIEDNSLQAVRNLVKSNIKQPHHIVSHHALARLEKFFVDNTFDLKDTLIVIDEAHHCSENPEDETKIGNTMSSVIKMGASIMYMTATPYRIKDNKPFIILPTNCHCIVRTIGEQMREHFSPAIEVIYTKMSRDSLIEDGLSTLSSNGDTRFSNETVFKEYYKTILKRWIEDNYPKSIIIIPSGDSVEKSIQFQKFFEAQIFPSKISKTRKRTNPKVLNAVGLDKDVIMQEIQSDRERNGQQYDLIIACKRCDEGTDIPSASHIYSIGIPQNLRLINQRIGRILRSKKDIPEYNTFFDEKWTNLSVVNYFLPLIGEVKNFQKQGGNQIIHSILVSEDYKKYCTDIPFIARVKYAIKTKLKKDTKKLEARLEYLDDFIVKNEINDPYPNLLYEIELSKMNRENLTVGQIPAILDNIDLTDENDKTSINLRFMNNIIPLNRVNEFVDTFVDKIIELPPKVKFLHKHVQEIFDRVVREFNNQHMVTTTTDKIEEVVYNFTGTHMKDICDNFYTSLEERFLKYLKEHLSEIKKDLEDKF